MDVNVLNLIWNRRASIDLDVTPQIALYLLTNHNGCNREKRASVIAKYASDMEHGRWLDNGEPIQFDWNGQAINGQHRLEAVWASQKTIRMTIVTGLDPAVRPTVDNHSKRSFSDALIDYPELVGSGESVSRKSAAAMWNAMDAGISQSKGRMTHGEALEFAKRYQEGGAFALTCFNKHARARAVYIAPVLAAVGRAFYHHKADLAKLERFVEVLATGFMRSPEDRIAVMCRNMLVEATEVGRNSNRSWEMYGKTCRAIQAYVSDVDLKKLYLPSDEPFPLPERSAPSASPRLGGLAGISGQHDEGRSPTFGLAATQAR